MTEHELLLQIGCLEAGRDALAALVAHLERAPLFDALAHAGERTWRGPTAEAFEDALLRQCDEVRSVVDQVDEYAAYIPGRLADLRWQLDQIRAAEAAAATAPWIAAG